MTKRRNTAFFTVFRPLCVSINQSCFAITPSIVLTTFSFVKPNFSKSFAAGADAPKPFIVTVAPSRPTYLPQPKSAAASTATRARTSCGRTLSLYSALCASKSSWHGMETTRTSMPCAASSFCASMARLTSEPVPIRMPFMSAGSFASDTT